jgi:hypothetical protein
MPMSGQLTHWLFLFSAAFMLIAPGCGGEQKFGVFNASPTATIIYPADGETVSAGVPLNIIGSVADADNAVESLSPTWLVDGERVCTEAVVSEKGQTECPISFTEGDKTITLQVNDPQAAAGTDTITIHVLPNQAPTITFHDPETDSNYYANLLISFMVAVDDVEDPSDLLRVEWNSSIDGNLPLADLPDSAGQVFGNTSLSEGKHLITATVTDSMGATGVDTVTVNVGPPNSPPTCAIINPTTGLVGIKGQNVNFQGSANDADEADELLTVEWSSDKDGVLGSSTPTTNGDVALQYDLLSEDAHIITLTVIDDLGESCAASIFYTVGTPPEITLTSPNTNSTFKAGTSILFTAEVLDPDDPADMLTLKWDSSLDGIFNTDPSDSSGIAQFYDDTLSVGTHNLTVTVTDTDGLNDTAVVTFEIVANQTPSIATVDISPNPATVTDVLTCSYSGFADPEGDPDLSTFVWTVQGVVQQGIITNTLSGAFQKGDSVTCDVTPHDGTDAGTPMSASITIQNSLPVVATATISPKPATVTDALTCSYAGFADADLDADSSIFEWTVNGGTPLSTINTLSSGYAGGDAVVCTVTPFDGEEYGVPVSDVVIIDSTAPSIASVSIAPNPAVASELLTCSYTGFADPDGDPDLSTFAWTVEGVQQGITSNTLSGAFQKGDNVTCTVTPDDGTGTGTPVSDSILIDNSAPTVSNVVITPANPIASDDLTCSYSFADPDSDPDQSTISWSISGTNVGTGATLPASMTASGDIVVCEVTANDGTDSGNTDSASVVIGNSVPVASSVFITPNPATKADVLTCNYSFSDPDGDPDSSTFEWSVNNGGTVGNASTLSGAFNGGDLVTCTVTPNDGIDAGTPVTGAILISNTAPTIASVTITPNPAIASDTLSCTYSGFSDADGDADASTYLWTVNQVSAGSSSTLTYSLTKGDEVSCEVTPGDGTDQGTPLSDTVIIDNAAPVVSSVAISPLSPAVSDDLVCTYSFTDPDGDPDQSQMSWEVNSGSVPYYGNILPAGVAATGDTATCIVVANDGSMDGNTDSASVVIGNSTPVASNVTISPNPAFAADTLTCSYSFSDGDGDPDQSIIQWTNSQGAVVGTNSTLSGIFTGGDQVSCTVTPFDGVVTGTPVVATIVISNSAPSVANVLISPNPADATDTLNCSYSGFVDVDGDPDSSTYAWTMSNGNTVNGTSTLSSGYQKGDTVTCVVTPFDGTSSGTPVSASIVIGNAAPTVTSVAISPLSPSVNDDLTCTYTFTDPDGDADQSEFEWETTSGGIVGNGSTLSAGNALAGDTVTCRVTAKDGTDTGNTDSASVVIGNSTPVASNVSISPNPAYAADTLTCSYSFTDGDNDPDQSTIEWEVQQVPVGSSASISGLYQGGDQVSCTVTPYDGIVYGTPVVATIVISSSAPSVASVLISPDPAYETDALSCSYSGFADPDCPNGSCDQSTFEWFVEGISTGVYTSTLMSGFSAGEEVRCDVTPFDGNTQGTVVSDSIVIENSAPTVSAVVITPSSPVSSDDLTCSYSYYDPNNDPDQSQMSWHDSLGTILATGAVLPAGMTAAGDTITCQVVANDGSMDGNTDSASVVIGGGAPTVSDVLIAPNPAYAPDTLTCSYTFTDPDGDPDQSSLIWFVNQVPQSTSGNTLSGVFFVGDEVTCQVEASDGAYTGNVASDTIIISNSVPTTPTVYVSPHNPQDNYQLFCVISMPSTDADNETLSYTFEWTQNNNPTSYYLANGTPGSVLTVQPADTFPGDVWECTVTPYDAAGPGTPMSASLTVQNPCSPSTTLDWSGSYSLCIADTTFTGEAIDDRLGSQVAPAGDIDGDGFDDLILGAYNSDGGGTQTGSTYLFFGDTASAGGALSATAADAEFIGESSGDKSGTGSASAGDIDGNGRPDLLVNASNNSENGSRAGKTYLFTDGSIGGGGTFSMSSALADDSFLGEAADDISGHAVASAGDVDNDGLDDILISAYKNSDSASTAGKTYLFFGRNLQGSSTPTDLSTADVTFSGINAGDSSGCAVAGAGDLDADGLDDILISSCSASSWAGETYVFLGKTILTNNAFNLSNADIILEGENGNDLSGMSLSTAGDVDGDGQDDILIGAPGVWPFSYSYTGKVYLLFGKSLFPTPTSAGGTQSLASADVIFTGTGNGTYAGLSVAGGGDVDGDGRDDVLIGSFWAGTNKTGETYLWLASSIANGGVFDLSNSDATFVGETSDDESGAAVSFAGDVDGDNLEDLLIGARGNDEAGDRAGKAYLLLSPYNAPPSAPSVDAKPKPATESDYLRCRVLQAAVDPEGDPLLYTFRWTLNGSSTVVEITDMPQNTTHDLPASYTTAGDTWTCEIFASDGLAAAQAPSGFSEIQVMP